MPVAYAPNGLFGVFTPQANTTVEPELALLMPPGYACINARMTSPRSSINERLVDYMEQFPGSLAQFANAPLDAVAIACTGASYLIGHAREAAIMQTIATRAGIPALTGASASVDALRALGACRIGLLSPYPADLDGQSAAFWRGCGFEVAAEASAFQPSADFHPIYSMAPDAPVAALDELARHDLDAVLLLGTGMPSLPAIAARPFVGRAPVLSCMLALAWRCVVHRDPEQATRAALLNWIGGNHWKEPLARQAVRQ